MVRTVRVLVASGCCMLAASVVVAVVALIFHPTKSETAKLLAELRPKVQQALCEANLEKDETKCAGISQSTGKDENDVTKDVGCKLTEARVMAIKKAVKDEFDDGKKEKLLENLQNAVHHVRNGSTMLQRLEDFSLNVPRPSAHWFIKGFQGNITWAWQPTRSAKHAHSRNGITHEGGEMRVKHKGWYHIYFQVDFRTNATLKKPARFEATIQIKGEQYEKSKRIIDLMSVGETSACKRRHPTPHPCVVLKKSGIYPVLADDLLSVKLTFPDEATVDTGGSRSFLGAYYIRHISASSAVI